MVADAPTRVPDPAEAGRPQLAIVSLLAVIAAGLVLLIAGLALGVQGSDVPMLAYAALTACLCFVPVCLDRGRPSVRRHILLSTISLFFSVRFVLPVLTFYIPAVGPVDPPGMTMSNLLPADIVHTQALVLLALLCMYVGYATPAGRGLSKLVPTPRWEWTGPSTVTAAVALISLGWLLYLARQFGLLPPQIGSGFIGGFTDATLFGPAILTVAYLRHRSKVSVLLLLIIIPATSFFNFFTGYKRLVLTPPAMMALAWIVVERRIRAVWLIAGLLALLSLYPVAQFYREVILVDNTRTLADVLAEPAPAVASIEEFLSENSLFDYVGEGWVATGRRLDGIGHAAVIIRDTPAVVPFQKGSTLALIPITYIPRFLWPGKPDITIGAWIVDSYRIRGERIESSIGPTWVGEFYLNFGTPGVVIGMLVMGILFRLAHESLVVRSATVLAILLETMILYEAMLKLTGSVATVVNGPIMAMIPILTAHVFVRFFGGARRWRAESEASSDSTSTTSTSTPAAS